jgi:hypothetical protein
MMGGVRVLSQFSTQHSGSGFVPCECSTELQGENPLRCHIRRASKHEDGHEPLMYGERLQGGARDC